MQGLPHLEHHVVGDVYWQRNRANAREHESCDHERRGGQGRVNTAHRARDKSVAPLGPADRSPIREGNLKTGTRHWSDTKSGVLELGASSVVIFACYSPNRERVAPIRCDVDLHCDIVKAEQADGISTNLCRNAHRD